MKENFLFGLLHLHVSFISYKKWRKQEGIEREVSLYCNFLIKKCHINKKMTNHCSISHVSNTTINN